MNGLPLGSQRAHATVLVAGAHALMRAANKRVVGDVLATACIVEAEDGDRMLRLARQYPDVHVAIADLKMPGMHEGFRLLELARRHPQLRHEVLCGEP